MGEPSREHPSAEELDILAEVSQLLTVVDLEHVIQEVMRLISQAVGAQKTSIFLYEGQKMAWSHLITMRDLSADQTVKVVSQVLETGFAGWVYKQKRGDIISDTTQDARWITFPDDPIVTRSALCVPFIHHGDVIATITLVHSAVGHFQPYHLRLVEVVANQTVVAIHNAQLFSHLTEQRQQLHATLQSMRDVLIVLDHTERIVILNQAALPLLDISSQGAALGLHMSQLPERDAVFNTVMTRLKAGHNDHGDDWQFEVHSIPLDTDYQVQLSAWNSDDDLLGYVIVMTDVTHLRDLAHFKNEMLSIASHDLRGPLALVAGYIEMIIEDTPDPTSPIHQYVETIKLQLDKMGTLIDDILHIERIRKSPLELRKETNLAEIVKVVLVNSRPLADAKQIRLETEIDLEGLPRVVVDPILVRQAMDNLLGNAIKYTPEQGTVSVQAHYDATTFQFAVRDTGIGIAPEHQPYVFESFYRVNNRKIKAKGSGLGLSLVKNVVTRHDGNVWLESEEGVGSTFGLWLPLYVDPVLDAN